MNENFFAIIEARAPTDRDQILLRTAEGVTHSYQDMLDSTARVANALADLGLNVGDRVSAQLEKSVEGLWLYLGVLRAGLVFHPLNPAYALDEMRYFLENAAPALFVCDPSRADDYAPLCRELGVEKLLTLDANGRGTWFDTAAAASSQCAIAPRAADDLAALLYSSGTTGRPKGIMLTHRNLASNAGVLVDTWGFKTDDVLLHALPIYHVHGLFVAIHCVLMSGSSMLWLDGLDVALIRRLLPEASVMMGVPTYYTRLLSDPDFGASDCPSMRLFISGSAPLLKETFIEFRDRVGHDILERYGMSETGMNTSNPLDGERKPGTVGFPLRGTEVRITDSQGAALPVGEIGELQVRGDNVFKGYWGMPEKTAADFTDDGWFITGDQGMIDGEGYVSIVGRSKDMVITGGLNVYPKEVELLINDIPGVLESAVFGVPHPDFGEAVVAAVVTEAGATVSVSQINDTLYDKLARFKQPKKIEFLDALPRNAMGKVQKKQLREEWNEPFE
ncbi:AMP-dependent synthetase and ligase [Luminiphilus syltensis NOR5-1B]|uniref:AMP-dependent synthetase and ligase n=1 Tax=Luminiphilus syltensis NOR5-1B TaxID=565045 RepID=B8KQE6_9GAMM|nr:AMP-binding protein [Luminiphilus syltensis]EED35743.1 AMP-dependent synthetase and ligase [Luminiphilus syltensis NOR5-1B]